MDVERDAEVDDITRVGTIESCAAHVDYWSSLPPPYPPLPRVLAPNFMVDSFAGRTYKHVQRFTHKATRAVMRSHHFRIPVYDMPIRLRPVRHPPPLTFSRTLNRFWPVVCCLYVRRHAGIGFPRVHTLLPFPTARWQTPAFHVLRVRNRRVLLHLRRGRVCISPTLLMKSTLISLQ